MSRQPRSAGRSPGRKPSPHVLIDAVCGDRRIAVRVTERFELKCPQGELDGVRCADSFGRAVVKCCIFVEGFGSSGGAIAKAEFWTNGFCTNGF